MMEAADNTTTTPITSIVTHAFSMRPEKQQQSYDIRESFSPDLVLQRRLQESQQSMHFNDGMTSARFNNYQESEEESSRRRRNKRIKPRALEVSDFSAGRGQNSTSRNNSNLNSQRNFLNSHRTNQSGLSSRGGNSMQNSGNGEMLSSTVVKDKHAERSEGNSNCVSPFSAREVKAAQSAYLSNIEEVSELLPQSKRQQHMQQQQYSGVSLHRQRNFSNDESTNHHVISPISPGMNSLAIRDYPEFQLLTQSEQYQRNGYSSDGSTRARKLVSQPSLRQFNHVNAYEESRQQQQQQSYQTSAAILERKSSVYGIECEEELRASGEEAILNEGGNHRSSSSRLQFQHQNSHSRPNQQHFHVSKQSQGLIEQTQQQFYQHHQQYLPHFSIQQQQQHSQYIDQAQFIPTQGLHQTWEQQPQQDYQQAQYQHGQQDQVMFQLIQQNTQRDQQYNSDQQTIVSNQYPSSTPQYSNLLQRVANHSDRHSYPDELGPSTTTSQEIQHMHQSDSNRNSQERNTKNLDDNIKNGRNSIGTMKGCGIATLPLGNSSLKLTSDLLNASGLVYTEEHGDRILAVSRQNTLEAMSNSGMRKQGLEISSLEISNSNHNNERYLAESKEDEVEIDENAELALQQSQTSNSQNQKIRDRLCLKQSQQSVRSSKSPLRECTQRLNNSMGELTGAKSRNEQQKITMKSSKDAKSCRAQFNRDSENDSDKENNLQQSASQMNTQDGDKLNGSQKLRDRPRASSSFKSQATIDQAEYEQIFKLLIHERDRNSSLETQLRDNNQTIHLLRQTITENITIQQSQRNYQDILRQKEEQLNDLQRTVEELKQQLQEINKNNQQLLQEKLLLVEQNTQLLDQNRELKRRSQENELKGKALEGESQNGNNNERKKENVKKEQDLGRRKSQILEEQALKHSNSHNNNGCTFQTEDETGHNLSSVGCSTAYKTNQSSLKTNTTANTVTITSSNFYKGSQNTNTHSSINNSSNNQSNSTPISNSHNNIRRAEGNRIDGDIDSSSQNQQSFLDISYTKKPKSPRNISHSSSSEINQFISCVLGMIEQCAPAGSFTENQPNSLKRSWKILKQIMENYIVLKKTALNNVNSLEILCSSVKVLGLENVDMLPNALERLVERSNRDRAQCKVYCEKLRRLQHALSYIQENQCNLLDYDTAEDTLLDRSSFTMKSNLDKGEKDISLVNREMDYLNNENQQRHELKRNQKKQQEYNQDYDLVDNCSNNEGDQEYDCVNRKSNLSHRSHLIELDNSQDGNFTFKSMNVRQYNNEPSGVALKKTTTPRASMINNHSPYNHNSFITNDILPEYSSNSNNNDAELSRRSKQHSHELQQNSVSNYGRHSNKIPNQHKAIEDSLDNSLIQAIMTNQNTQGQFGIPRRTSSEYSPAGQTIVNNKSMAYNQLGRITEKQQYQHTKDASCGFQQFQEEPQQHGFRTIQPQRHWQQQQQQHQQVQSYGLEEINGNMDNNSFHKRRQSSASTTSPLARPPTHKHKQTTLKNASINNSIMQ